MDSSAPTEAFRGRGFEKHSAKPGLAHCPAGGKRTTARSWIFAFVRGSARQASRSSDHHYFQVLLSHCVLALSSHVMSCLRLSLKRGVLLPGPVVALGLGAVVPRHVLTPVSC
jgi:hypothetical protein